MANPDHTITITRSPLRQRVSFNGRVIADSAAALILKEGRDNEVVYFPRRDVVMDFMARTTHASRCPYKGDASYYSLRVDGELAEKAVWTYGTPKAAVAEIKGHMAFCKARFPGKLLIEPQNP